MAGLLQKLRQMLRRPVQQDRQTDMQRANDMMANGDDNFILTEKTIKDLMQQIEQTREGMFTCAETYALLDEYVDLVVDNEEAAKLMPLVEQHLAVCPDCHEEFEMLRDILHEDSDRTNKSQE